jgi:hypothetical protein
MATRRKPRGRKTTAAKTPLDIATAKVLGVARKAQGLVDVAGHDAALALRRTRRQLETTLEEAKGPAQRRVRKIRRDVLTAFENAGASMSTAVRRARSRLP